VRPEEGTLLFQYYLHISQKKRLIIIKTILLFLEQLSSFLDREKEIIDTFPEEFSHLTYPTFFKKKI